MTNKSNVRKIVAAVFLLVLVSVGLLAYGLTHQGHSKTNPQNLGEKVKESQKEKDKQKNVATSADEKQATAFDMEAFLKLYNTWELNAPSLEKRAQELQAQMTDRAYKESHIQEDAQSLSAMIETFQREKTINTSNSSQLVARQYEKSHIYQDAQNKDLYYVELFYTETPIYQDQGYRVESKLNLLLRENKVDAIKISETKAQQERGDNG